MSFGRFQEWGRTNSDGPKLRIGGKWVFPDRRCNLDGVNPGMDVEYETHMGGRDGKLVILDRIRPAPAGSVPSSAGSAQGGSTITDGDILRSVSNVVGQACAAGTIASHDDVHVWIMAAYTAFTQMGKDVRPAQAPSGGQSQGPAPKDPPRREPGQDDEPFFDDSDNLRFT